MTNLPSDPNGADPLGLANLTRCADAAASICNNIINRVSGAIGIAYDDLMVVIRARRQAKAKVLLATADASRHAILARTDRTISLGTALLDEQLEARAMRRLIAAATRHQENIEEITFEAIEHIIEQAQEGRRDISTPTDEPTTDWMAEFTDMCMNCTDSKMRQLWGRVLAGETQRPGSFSIRSLFTLKTLLPDEAEQFSIAGNLVLQGEWIYRGADSEAASPFGVGYQSFQTLAACGIFTPGSNSVWGAGEPNRPILITYEPYLLMFERTVEAFAPMQVPSWALTAVGKELLGLLTVEHNWEYVKRFVEEQSAMGWHLDVILTPEGFPRPSAELPTQFSK